MTRIGLSLFNQYLPKKVRHVRAKIQMDSNQQEVRNYG